MSFVINPYMFGLRNQFWTNLSSTNGKVITGFNSTFTNAATVNWGDGTTTPLTSDVSVNKTLGTTNAIELETNNAVVTAINCGTSSPKLAGTINLFAFPDLQNFTCAFNDITAISGYENHSNLNILAFNNNKVTGSIPSLSNTNLSSLICYDNLLNGTVSNFSSGIQIVSIHTNQLVGSIPVLTEYQNLNIFHCFQNLLSGSIPNLSSNINLTDFRCQANFLTGSIPDLSACTKLINFECDTQLGENKLTNFAGGSVSDTLGVFRASNNQLTSTAVNAILAAFVAAGRTSGTRILELGGTGNASPTGQGITDRQTLLNRGWRTATGSTAITN